MPGIVVGVDGSDYANRALEWAIHEAGLRSTPLTVLAVHQVLLSHWPFGPAIYPQDEAIRQQVKEAVKQARAKTVARFSGPKPPSVQVKIVSGIAAYELIKESAEADMLVVGTRGVGGFERLLLGSVSTEVAHYATCPVVIVR